MARGRLAKQCGHGKPRGSSARLYHPDLGGNGPSDQLGTRSHEFECHGLPVTYAKAGVGGGSTRDAQATYPEIQCRRAASDPRGIGLDLPRLLQGDAAKPKRQSQGLQVLQLKKRCVEGKN